MNIIYRKINKKDYKDLKYMINTNFYLYEYIKDKRILDTFLNTYLYSCLVEKTFSMVAEKDGKIIGIILGNAKNRPKDFKWVINNILMLYYIILLSIKSKIYHTDIKQYKGITKIYKKLMKDANKNFDGILTLFVVSPRYQGYGIGNKLLNYFFEYEKRNNVKNIYVYTDSKCNYRFYDRRGFKRLGKDVFNHKKFDLSIFLYEYNFQEQLK